MATLDDATFDAIVGDIACDGNLRGALRKHKIHPQNFYRYINADEKALSRYANAKTAGCNKLADDLLKLQDQKPPLIDTQFGKKIDPGWVQWQRNRIDTRKWLLSKLVPKTYGDRTVLAGDADNPLAFVDADAATVRSKLLSGAAVAATPGAAGDAQQ